MNTTDRVSRKADDTITSTERWGPRLCTEDQNQSHNKVQYIFVYGLLFAPARTQTVYTSVFQLWFQGWELLVYTIGSQRRGQAPYRARGTQPVKLISISINKVFKIKLIIWLKTTKLNIYNLNVSKTTWYLEVGAQRQPHLDVLHFLQSKMGNFRLPGPACWSQVTKEFGKQ